MRGQVDTRTLIQAVAPAGCVLTARPFCRSDESQSVDVASDVAEEKNRSGRLIATNRR